ncbi:unnamed protein product [Mucor hiemalis]
MKINPRVFFDIDIHGNRIGRIIMELFADEVPKTAENFRALCTGELGLGKVSNTPLHYRGSILHRIIKGFMCQGGDFTRRNGAGGESIYGATFPDESFQRKHDTHGLLSMANRGPNTQSSQFFMTTRPTPHLDGKHVVFGKIVVGYNILEMMENEPVDDNSRPLHNVMIANCGELVLKLPPGVKLTSTPKAVSDSESDEKKKSRKRLRFVSALGSDRDVSSGEEEEEEEEKRRSKKHKKHSKKKKDHKKSKKSHRHHRKSRDRSESPAEERKSASPVVVPAASLKEENPRYREYKDKVAEKPEWEQRRRFNDEPDVNFKGRGRKKFSANGRGGMRGF